MKRQNTCLIKSTIIFGIITIVLAISSYSYFDRSIVDYIYNSEAFNGGVETTARMLAVIFEPKMWVVITGVATLLCIYKYFKNEQSDKLYILSLSLIMTIIVVTVLKYGLARYRPGLYLFDNQYGFHFLSTKRLNNSMPSGHTALTFAGLLALANISSKKWIMVLAIVVAIVVAISRVVILDHYLSDVLVATYIGVFSYLWSKAFVECKSKCCE